MIKHAQHTMPYLWQYVHPLVYTCLHLWGTKISFELPNQSHSHCINWYLELVQYQHQPSDLTLTDTTHLRQVFHKNESLFPLPVRNLKINSCTSAGPGGAFKPALKHAGMPLKWVPSQLHHTQYQYMSIFFVAICLTQIRIHRIVIEFM